VPVERPARDVIGPPERHILVTDLDGEMTLYDPKRNEVHSLNATASDIWRLLDGTHRFEEVVEQFAGAHNVDPDAVRPYVAETISCFVELRLLAGGSKDERRGGP
jgi:hypothetical protein